MMELSEPSAEGLCQALERALTRLHGVDPHAQHERVRVTTRMTTVLACWLHRLLSCRREGVR